MNEGFVRTLGAVIDAVALGHQMGQWSERRRWGHVLDGKDEVEGQISDSMLLDVHGLQALIENPPFISTPGWGPTGFADNIPHITGLMKAYRSGALSPEGFRDFLLASRDWLLPQGVGRTCLELMAEGMNPRIAGLHAPSIVSGSWMMWPIGLFHAGNPGDAYEDGVALSRTMSGGDIVELTGAFCAALSVAVLPGATWESARAALLEKLENRNPNAHELVLESLDIGRNAADETALAAALRDKAFLARTCKFNGTDGMQSCYAAVAVLEYALRRDLDWLALVRAGLMQPDTRFGAMLFCGLYAAFKGTDWPAVWNDSLEKVHPAERRVAKEAIAEAIGNKLKRELDVAREASELAGRGDAEQSRLYDRMLAGFLAGTAANAMGSPVEDRDYPWIVEHHGVVEKILDMRRFESEDDAAMGLMWADTVLRCGGRMFTEDLDATLRDRMNPNNFYYDTQHAYNLMMEGVPPHACGHWNIVTGSALMGCNVIGMYHVCDSEQARTDGLEVSYQYQRGFDVHAAAILCAATAEALRDGATVDSVVEAAIHAAPEEDQECFDEKNGRNARRIFRKMIEDMKGQTDVLSARQAIYDSFYAYNGQDPWEVIAYTLAIFKVANGDVWQAAVGGTNIGRDSDTIACQAALLTACMTGMRGVPEYLLSVYDEKAKRRYADICRGLVELVRKKCGAVSEIADKLGVSP